jgi:hypothetical protein
MLGVSHKGVENRPARPTFGSRPPVGNSIETRKPNFSDFFRKDGKNQGVKDFRRLFIGAIGNEKTFSIACRASQDSSAA